MIFGSECKFLMGLFTTQTGFLFLVRFHICNGTTPFRLQSLMEQPLRLVPPGSVSCLMLTGPLVFLQSWSSIDSKPAHFPEHFEYAL